MKSRVILLLLFVCAFTASAQRKIVGFVIDSETKKPLSDVIIIVKGTPKGTVSNRIGAFEITVEASQTALFASHIGFKVSEVPIPAEDRFKFALEKEVISLGRLVLAGFPKDPLSTIEPLVRIVSDTTGVVQRSAEPPESVANFMIALGNGIHEAAEKHGGPVNVTFTIDATGKATDIKIDVNSPAVAEAVTRTLNGIAPWKPAMQNQKKVSQHFMVTVVNNPDDSGLAEFYKFFTDNLKYPAAARRGGVDGALEVDFKVDTYGNITDIFVINDIGAGVGKEVVRVLTAIPPRLAIYLVNETLSERFVLPISFGLGDVFKRRTPVIAPAGAHKLGEIIITAIGVKEHDHPYGKFVMFSTDGLTTDEIREGLDGNVTYAKLEEALSNPDATKLALRNQGLETFPPEILTLKKLVFLDLQGNKIKTIPAEISKLKKLKKLVITGNPIDQKEIDALKANLPKTEIIL